jgi:hypothetical protein
VTEIVRKTKLSVTRAQFGDNDRNLYFAPSTAPEHLTHPLTDHEIIVKSLLMDCPDVEAFIKRATDRWPGSELADALLERFARDGAQLKAKGLSSAEVRELKGRLLLRWAHRMTEVLGMPTPWVKKWMRVMGCYNAKGKLKVEFGGTP